MQIQTDPRDTGFPARAQRQSVLGVELPVARLEDTLAGKVGAALDPERCASKRQKDLADIARLLEAFPHLRAQVPDTILERLL